MLKRKRIVGFLIVMLAFVVSGCGNVNTSSEVKSDKKEADYTKFESDLDILGTHFSGIIFYMMDNDINNVNIEAEKLIKSVASTQEKLDSNKVSEGFKKDLLNLLDLDEQFGNEIIKGNYNVSDLSNSIGTQNRTIADEYNDGELPNSLAKFTEKLEKKQAEIEKEAEELANKVYKKDEFWEVPGQWKLKVNGVRPTDDRNQFSDKKPGQVVIVDYTYENLGYTSDIQDLYITPSSIIDSSGQMGDTYPASTENSPKPTPVGATTSNAQQAFGLITPGGNVKIIFNIFDSNHKKQNGNFELPVE
ncbi:hypothetical protein P7H60_07600 [Vagococcus carniphilus]|uniref:hypothetical protein n=1 Tax=Vagococcus carniphilus TaxID=218144 RepID=UPI00288D51B0|nr:hypothetical protein [Vagococcus carniphilus]MDT2849026.1 hypothetical protein [Vagococcus carniphilus]